MRFTCTFFGPATPATRYRSCLGLGSHKDILLAYSGSFNAQLHARLPNFTMNPSRSKPSPTERPPLDSPQTSSATPQTSLPSIRQLHPYLPPSGGMSQHFQSEGMSYGFSQPASYPSAQSRFENDAYGHSVDSENEDADPQGPPKKKRRRQALSCTG